MTTGLIRETINSNTKRAQRAGREPRVFVDSGKGEITAVTSTHLHLRTNYWSEVNCTESTCILDADHVHSVYDTSVKMQDKARVVKMLLCTLPLCNERNQTTEDEWHVHQGNGILTIDLTKVTQKLHDADVSDMEQLAMVEPQGNMPSIQEEDMNNVRVIDDLIGELVQANERQVQEVKRRCARQGIRTPYVDETVRPGYLQGEYPCPPCAPGNDYCTLRRLPHYHLQHYDPYRPHRGMPREEAEEAARTQPQDCGTGDCAFEMVGHFHHPKNE